MTDRPILFSAPMVRALLDGRKTQTRRLAWRDWQTCPQCNGGGNCPKCEGAGQIRKPTIWQKVKPGDRLWVRETWHTHAMFDNLPPRDITARSVHFAADGPAITGKTRTSIHMPRWASRLTLVVTETRMERLQDISFEDCRAEGMDQQWSGPGCGRHGCRGHYGEKWHFLNVWESLHGPSWDSNPEVVALTFTVHHRNIDSMETTHAQASC